MCQSHPAAYCRYIVVSPVNPFTFMLATLCVSKAVGEKEGWNPSQIESMGLAALRAAPVGVNCITQ